MKRVLALLMMVVFLVGSAVAEETYYVLCKPDSFVYVREFPKKNSEEIGFLYYGDSVEVDGKKRNGYWHVVGVNTESGDGWVRKLYLDDDEPIQMTPQKYLVVSKGRLATRNGVKGKRQGWLKPGSEIKVYGMNDEWAVTNKGYVKAEYLEVLVE